MNTSKELKALKDLTEWVIHNTPNIPAQLVEAKRIIKESEQTAERFPNGFTSWYETHHEVVSKITLEIARDGQLVEDIMARSGTGGLYELGESLTDEFEKKNIGREWDGEFFDEIESFLTEKFNTK